MASDDDPLRPNPNHLPQEQKRVSKFAEANLPKFQFRPEYRSVKPQVTRLVSKYIEHLNTIQDARGSIYNTLRDPNLSDESAEKASMKMHNKLFAMVRKAKEDFNEITKLGGNAPSVPARFDSRVVVRR